MTCILAFDSSAAHCAAALLCDDTVHTRIEAMDKGQAERLIPLLEELLAETGTSWADLDAIAVGVGPGNFTGVRIAVAAARGLALGRGIPAIGISTLEALAYGQSGPVTVVQDARRGAAYVQDFVDGLPTAAPALVHELTAITGTAFVGELAEQMQGELRQPALPLPAAMARIAAARLGQDNPRPAPLYLRAADAAPARDLPPAILPDAPVSEAPVSDASVSDASLPDTEGPASEGPQV